MVCSLGYSTRGSRYFDILRLAGEMVRYPHFELWHVVELISGLLGSRSTLALVVGYRACNPGWNRVFSWMSEFKADLPIGKRIAVDLPLHLTRPCLSYRGHVDLVN